MKCLALDRIRSDHFMSADFKADLDEVCFFLSIHLLGFHCILLDLSFCSLMEVLDQR